MIPPCSAENRRKSSCATLLNSACSAAPDNDTCCFPGLFKNPSSNLSVSVVSIKPEKTSLYPDQPGWERSNLAATSSGEAHFCSSLLAATNSHHMEKEAGSKVCFAPRSPLRERRAPQVFPHPGWVGGSCSPKWFWLSEAQKRPNHLELLGCIKSPVAALPMPCAHHRGL